MSAGPAIELRPVAADGELDAFLSVHNTVAPELAEDAVEARYAERFDPTLCRFLALHGDRPVGAAQVGRMVYQPLDAEVLYAGMWVLPDARGRGAGGVLLDALLGEARRRGKPFLEGPTSDADAAGSEFLRRRGFAERDRSRYVALDLTAGPPAPADPRPGVVVTSLAEQPALVRDAYRIACEAIPDVPEEEPMSAGSYEEWRGVWVDPPSVLPESFFVALADGKVAGYSTLALPRARPGVGVHTMTAVSRAFRGRGVAAALKRHAVAWAAERGLRSLESENVEANAPIRALNELLGYRPLHDHVWLHGPRGG